MNFSSFTRSELFPLISDQKAAFLNMTTGSTTERIDNTELTTPWQPLNVKSNIQLQSTDKLVS